MAWPTKTQFQAVERLPVPPEVHESFKKLESANVGRGYASGKGIDKVLAAESKVATRAEEAATHFGGDLGRMTTHFKRWQRWGGAAMSPAGLVDEFAGIVAGREQAHKFNEDVAKEDSDEEAFKRGKKPTRTPRTTS